MFDIVVTIVNYKMAEDIRDLLHSMKSDLIGSDLKVQIVVVDNTPEEGAWLMFKNNFPEVKYLPQESNVGFGKAQNIGIKSTEAKYHFILNPDAVFPSGERVLQRLFEHMETHPKIGMVGPKLLNSDNSLQYSCYRFPDFWIPLYRRSSLGEFKKNHRKVARYLMHDFNHDRNQPVDWIMGSAMFARGIALEQTGLFDERYFMYFEDCDLCRRFWDANWPIYYIHDIKIKHRHGKGSAKVPGFLSSIMKNPLTRVHIISWLQYMWKWRFKTI
ncbi:MAG TPA: hypothetical protein DEB73_01785 [Candidatus Magasanikbacteria bacterium]|uniref:Glycosyltransferase 2-like domain-containing protein n=2 Tax=Candidatus Magasanikiibacteriota TaxID=1752731 RepID=A0A0G0ZHP2_9BACT|nr:MAG: hypothetical protein UU49_C0029G0003 [Candidatus Magasanikbacteria bacterium GW2011_GWC2_41_17]KKS12553.1 MAG: hypothetical protein UU69_C0031G0002 [Candidatus Magasanikbacteria bacterium GW2011_GWA2_41_55]HBV57977.1 hypothetical protein [Candidatus Magasanikbacteria bacterium]HBX15994.1 hypothetical protein [Candidatus Magasanikbacteria bacterium]